MLQRIILTIMFCCLGGTAGVVEAFSVHKVDVTETQSSLAPALDYYEDAQAKRSFVDLMALSDWYWNANTQDVISFGYSSSAYWLRADLTNPGATAVDRVLEISNPLLDAVDVYLTENGQLLQHYSVGDAKPFRARVIKNRHFWLPLVFDAGKSYRLYVRVKTDGAVKVPLELWERAALNSNDDLALLGNGLFFGALIVISFFNLFLWSSVRDTSYLFYVMFVLGFGATVAALSGFLFQHVWPDQVVLNGRSVPIFLCLSLMAGAEFSRRFLDLARYQPKLELFTRFYMLAAALALVLSLLIQYRVALIACVSLSIVGAITCFTSGIASYRAGNRSARFYIMAWSAMLIGTLIYALMSLGIFDAHMLFEIAPQIGELIEVLFLSFALADRINAERQEKMTIQKRILEEERKANQEREACLRTRLSAQLEELRSQQVIDETRAECSAKSLFLATMSHEIRTPMSGILGVAELLQDTELSESQQQQLEVIQNSGKSLLNIINDILDYSKIEAGKMDIESVVCDMEWLINDCRTSFADAAHRKALGFDIHVAKEVPRLIKSDPTRLRQIIGNLMRNALKFTSHGGVDVTLSSIATDNGKCMLRFDVSDSGVGLGKDQQQRLFKPFSQVDTSSTRKYGGTGMGLIISKKLVELLGGEIGVVSEEGKGSTFWFSVSCEPLVDAKNEGKKRESLEIKAARHSKLAGLRVLVAEDNAVNEMVIKGMLKKLQAEFVTVMDGVQAVSIFQSDAKGFDVVLMDCEMPNLDGYQATRIIRDWEAACGRSVTPILALTAHAMQEHRQQAAAAGMSGHINKPIEFELLKGELLKCIE